MEEFNKRVRGGRKNQFKEGFYPVRKMEMINKELEIFGPKTEIENGFDKRVVDGYSRTYVLGFNKKTKS